MNDGMKTNLTIEQSARLIELGIDASIASCTIVTDEYNETTDNFEHPAFSLSDIISLLPKEIEAPDYWGEVDACNLGIAIYNDVWEAFYYDVNNAFRKAPELIDALYELLCWVLANRPDEIKK